MSRGPETYAERNRRLLDEKVRELRAEGWDVLPRRDRDRALSERDDANDELALLRSEVERLREALLFIAKTWAHGNGAGPYASKALAGVPPTPPTREGQNG